MARTADAEIFLRSLPADDTAVGNYRLIEQLGWDEDRYWKVRDQLVDDGKIVRGRGRGGSVSRVLEKPAPVAPTVAPGPATSAAVTAERQLYPDLQRTLESHWKLERRLDQFLVEVTADQGSRATGGVWTRPDLTGVSVRRFAYVPGVHFDVWSFEIKPQWQTNVVGVFEAAAHSRFATRSYVMYHIDPAGDPVGSGALEACIREADRFNIGLVTFADPRDFKTWEVHSEPERRDPDPLFVDEFVATQLTDNTKREINRWLRS